MARVVWLDDQIDLFEDATAFLASKGHTVFTARSEEEAIALLGTGADLLIQDLSRPGVGGIAFVQSLRNDSQFGRLPVLIVSAAGDPNVRLFPGPHGGNPLPVQGWLLKPFSAVDLDLAVNSALEPRVMPEGPAPINP